MERRVSRYVVVGYGDDGGRDTFYFTDDWYEAKTEADRTAARGFVASVYAEQTTRRPQRGQEVR